MEPTPEESASSLTQWTVYRHPADYPEGWVLRRWEIRRGGEIIAREALAGPSLTAMRAAIPPGACNMGRMAADDPVIYETWM